VAKQNDAEAQATAVSIGGALIVGSLAISVVVHVGDELQALIDSIALPLPSTATHREHRST